MEGIQNKEFFNDTVTMLKACIVSKQEDICMEDINAEFSQFADESIPYFKLGFPSLHAFLRKVPDIKIERNADKKNILRVVDSKLSHIQELVKNQKENKNLKQRFYAGMYKQKRKIKRSDHTNKTPEYHRNKRRISNKRNGRGRNRQHNTINGDEEGYYSCGSVDEGYTNYNNAPVVIKIDPNRTMSSVCEPIAYHQQLIGDDFLLQLSIRELHANNLWKKTEKSAIHSGLCISGQTIKSCVNKLYKINSISSRIVIMIGAVDIYKGTSASKMIKDMQELLDLCEKKFLISKSAITLCTIPPLGNIPLHSDLDKLLNLYSFNLFIKNITTQNSTGYGLIDFFEYFSYLDEIGQSCTQYDLFQINARMVSGCSFPHLLWNKNGRKLAMQLLRESSRNQSDGFIYDHYY